MSAGLSAASVWALSSLEKSQEFVHSTEQSTGVGGGLYWGPGLAKVCRSSDEGLSSQSDSGDK